MTANDHASSLIGSVSGFDLFEVENSARLHDGWMQAFTQWRVELQLRQVQAV